MLVRRNRICSIVCSCVSVLGLAESPTGFGQPFEIRLFGLGNVSPLVDDRRDDKWFQIEAAAELECFEFVQLVEMHDWCEGFHAT